MVAARTSQKLEVNAATAVMVRVTAYRMAVGMCVNACTVTTASVCWHDAVTCKYARFTTLTCYPRAVRKRMDHEASKDQGDTLDKMKV